MGLKSVQGQWFKGDAQVLDDLSMPNPWPSDASLKLSPDAPRAVYEKFGGEQPGTYTAAPIPACPACESDDASIYFKRATRISATEYRFILGLFVCHACGLELHALPH